MKFHQSLISRILIVSVLILLSVASIVVIALFSFNHVEELLMGGISQDMEQMIANAAMRRKISQVLADTNLLVSTFSGREEFLHAEGTRLLTEIERCKAAPDGNLQSRRLLPPLEEFIQHLEALLTQAARINALSLDIQRIDTELTEELRAIEQTLVWQDALLMMESDADQQASLEKLHRLLPKYRQLLLQITVQIGASKQAHLGRDPVEEPYQDTILDLLRTLGADLALLKTLGGEALALQSEGFLDAISDYKTFILALHEAFRAFQERLRTLKTVEYQLASEIGEIDRQISQSTTQTFVAIAGDIAASARLMLGLSGVIILVVIILGVYMLRILRPIRTLADTANCFADGSISCSLQHVRSRDEIGMLSRAFQRLVLYIQDMAQIATEMSQGILSNSIQPKSNDDVLGNAFLNMVTYVQDMSAVTARIAEGDLRETIHLRSSDDTFGRAVQAMEDGLRSLIMRIRASAEQISATGRTIAEFSSRDIQIVASAATSVKHLDEIMEQMRASVEEVARNMEQLSSSVELTSASTAQMTLSIGHIADNTATLTRQTHQTIDAMNTTLRHLDQVVDKIDASRQLSLTTNQHAGEGTQAVEQVMGSMESIHQTVMTAVAAITRFSERSQDIDSILDVIRNITDQTALLALNASIIAAQAGAHGRGFAVVADEIRSLADGVGTSTKDIAAIVHTLKADTANVVQTIHAGAASVQQGIEHTEHARAALQKIQDSADHASTVVTEIAGTLHNLQRTSRGVAESMQAVERMTHDITTATNQQKTTTEQINQSIGHIAAMAAHTQQATADQIDGVQRVLDVTSDVVALITENHDSSFKITQTAGELSGQADLLLRAVDRFKLPTR